MVEDHRKDHRSQRLDRELRHREIGRAEEQKRQRNTVTSHAERQDRSDGGARSYSRNRARHRHQRHCRFGRPHFCTLWQGGSPAKRALRWSATPRSRSAPVRRNAARRFAGRAETRRSPHPARGATRCTTVQIPVTVAICASRSCSRQRYSAATPASVNMLSSQYRVESVPDCQMYSRTAPQHTSCRRD